MVLTVSKDQIRIEHDDGKIKQDASQSLGTVHVIQQLPPFAGGCTLGGYHQFYRFEQLTPTPNRNAMSADDDNIFVGPGRVRNRDYDWLGPGA